MTVFDNIKRFGKLRGMNVQEVALKAGLSKNVIYQYKKGTNPSLETLGKIAKALQVTVNDLLGKENEPQAKAEKKSVDIEDEDVIMTFEGKPIPPEDLELMKRLLRGKSDE